MANGNNRSFAMVSPSAHACVRKRIIVTQPELLTSRRCRRSTRSRSAPSVRLVWRARTRPLVGWAPISLIGKPLSTSIRAHLSDDMWAGRYDPPVQYMTHAKNGATLLSIMLGHGLESLSAVVANQRGAGVRLSDGTTLPKDAPDEIVVAGVLEGGIVTSLHYSAGQSAGSALVWEIQGTDLTITLSRGSEPVQVLQVPPPRLCGSRPATRRTRSGGRPPLRRVRRRPPRRPSAAPVPSDRTNSPL
ncbi:hypothetical protein RKD32_002091 [Streptomyces sp. SAI-195]